MKIFLESSNNRLFLERLRGQAQDALLVLEAEIDGKVLTEIKDLIAFMEEDIPLVFSSAYSLPQVADCFRSFYEFLVASQGQTDVAVVKGRLKGHRLLFTRAPDSPLLIDSVQVLLRRHGISFQMIGHPVFAARRENDSLVFSRQGELDSFLLIDMISKDGLSAARIEKDIRQLLKDVMLVATERNRMAIRLAELKGNSALCEHKYFLDWLADDNFYPFAYRRLHLKRCGDRVVFDHKAELSLGISDFFAALFPQQAESTADLDPHVRERILRKGPAVVEELDIPSPIYRLDNLTYLGFRTAGENDSWFEHAFIGLFTQHRKEEVNTDIPFLRNRLMATVEQLGFSRETYDFRKTSEIFNLLPKVELFFMAPEDYVQMVRSFRLLSRFGAVKVLTIRNLSAETLTLLIIMPREFYQPERLERMEGYLCRFFQSSQAPLHIVRMTDDYLSMHGYLRPAEPEGSFDLKTLEHALTRIMLPWAVKFKRLLTRRFNEKEGAVLADKYSGCFPEGYRPMVHPRFAVRDVVNMEKLSDLCREVTDIWGPFKNEDLFYRLQVYSFREIHLNELMPVLENLNLHVISEVDFRVATENQEIFIKSFFVRVNGGGCHVQLKQRLLDALQALRDNRLADDSLNRLVVLTDLSWQEVDVLRAYRNYCLQLGSIYSKSRIDMGLVNNHRVATLLFRYFEARFRPVSKWQAQEDREEQAISPLRLEFLEVLNSIVDVSEDKIFRTFFNLIDSTVRTNFFLRRDTADYFVSFKINALGIIDMPSPRPLYEIFVHAREMEGVHLRGGKVARGGIRWSDRQDDYRTEVLGLMKTQMTKNALIVPVGSKGGYVVKLPFTGREEGAELSRRAYERFIHGLLDLTDNLVNGQVTRSAALIAYDENDPYLVVAADKGTAHFSDFANGISQGYDFWLGDAFASGGSHGYDHKELGITARGAWVCVQRHFRELGMNIQEEPFTVIGIGDMGGDVFGNGMLCSRKTRLLGAFNHRHIFLDPDPDPEISFRERERLYKLDRSSWDDYDPALISSGGGVFHRTAKAIPLSEKVRNWLGTREESIDGDGLIRLLLAAEADLLWNGGIGTYVKASSENKNDVGDRSNMATRISANELKVRVVGEGGNLGFTQLARIEYAQNGGHINTDAIDNSGGVDCSDHEVNLKILLGQIDYKGKKGMPLKERNNLLEAVTDDVCAVVLDNNYRQSLCLSLDLLRCSEDVYPFLDLATYLVNKGLLDRAGENLPSNKKVLSRAERVLSRPELAILLAYSKTDLYQEMLREDLTSLQDSPHFLFAYFPEAVRRVVGSQAADHPLAREITATMVGNYVIDRVGCTTLFRLSAETGATLFHVASTYLIFDRALAAEGLRRQILSLDNRLPSERQYDILLRLEKALVFLCYWTLKHDRPLLFNESVTDKYRKEMEAYFKSLASLVKENEWRKTREESELLQGEGVPADVAERISALPYLKVFLPVAALVEKTGSDFYSVAHTYNELQALLEINDLSGRLDGIPLQDNWDRMAKQTLISRILFCSYRLTEEVWRHSGGNLESFLASRRKFFDSYKSLRMELNRTNSLNFNPFAVLVQALEEILPSDPLS